MRLHKFKGLAICLALVGCSWTTLATAQTYPNKPITLISSSSAGSQADVLARILAEDLNKQWGQPVNVDNRPGASGFIAAEAATRAAPDGYTLYMGSAGVMAINPHFHPKLPYDALTGYAPIAMAASSSFVFVVPDGAKARTVEELVQQARAQSASLTYGSLGNGSTTHIASAMFGRSANVQTTQVPYKGDAQIATDLMAGVIDFSILPTSTVTAQIRAGKLRALAVTSTVRLKQLPDVRTMQEVGYAGYEMTQWNGVYAPAATPPAIVKAVNDAVVAATRRDTVVRRLSDLGMEVQPMSVDTFRAFHQSQYKQWGTTMQALQIKYE